MPIPTSTDVSDRHSHVRGADCAEEHDEIRPGELSPDAEVLRTEHHLPDAENDKEEPQEEKQKGPPSSPPYRCLRTPRSNKQKPCDLVDQDAEAQVTAGDHKSASGMGHGYDR